MVSRTKGHPGGFEVRGFDENIGQIGVLFERIGQFVQHLLGWVHHVDGLASTDGEIPRFVREYRAKFHPSIQHEYIVALWHDR